MAPANKSVHEMSNFAPQNFTYLLRKAVASQRGLV